MQATFQGVWDDFWHLPKSAILKTRGYSPSFLLKIGRFRTVENSPEIITNKPPKSYECICKDVGDVSGSLGRFRELTKLRHLQNHGSSPGFLLKIGRLRTLGNSAGIITNKPQNGWKSVFKCVGDVSRSSGRFLALTKIRHCQKSTKRNWNAGLLFCTETVLRKQSFYWRPWINNSFELVEWILSNITLTFFFSSRIEHASIYFYIHWHICCWLTRRKHFDHVMT